MSKPTSEEIVTVLKQKVRDPELGMNIVDLGLVYNVEISDKNTAEVTMTLTSPGCPAGPEIITNVQRETHNAFPELDEVNVHLTWTPFWSPDLMSDEAKDELGIFYLGKSALPDCNKKRLITQIGRNTDKTSVFLPICVISRLAAN